MNLIARILGPKSKYDKTLPYTFEARVPMFGADDVYNSYFADTICGLVEHLHKNGIAPNNVRIVEIFQEQESALPADLYSTVDNRWRFRPEICHSFREHYKGHIYDNGCTFQDRDPDPSGPCPNI